MSLNWITEKELNEIPFDIFLLLEECQLNWINEERYADAWGLALRAHPYVVWAIAKRAPQKAAWAERMLKHGEALPPADTQVLFQAERTLLRAYEDWIAYAVNPEIYHRQPFLQWDERELTGLCDLPATHCGRRFRHRQAGVCRCSAVQSRLLRGTGMVAAALSA